MNDPRPDDLDRLWQTQETPKMDIPFETIRLDASRFQHTVRRRNAGEYVASAIAGAIFCWIAVAPSQPTLARVAAVLTTIGVAVMVTNLRLRGAADVGPGPQAATRDVLRWHRSELVRQRDLLRRVPVWYLGPIVPGIVLFIAASLGGNRIGVTVLVAAVVAGILGLIVFANRRAVAKLDARIAALPRDDDA